MREIEFKVWDTKKNKFLDGVPAMRAWLDSDSWDDPEEMEPYLWTCAETYQDRLIWLQYTGQKTNAKEKIFDGDIVLGHGNEGSGPEAIHYTSRVIVSWDEEYGKWIITEIGSKEKFDLYDYDLLDKKIGNIYEDKHLLELN